MVEWMRGTKERAVPVGAEIDGEKPRFQDSQPGIMAWIEDMASAPAEAAAKHPRAEPHGFTVEITEATVFVRGEPKDRFVKKYRGDVRFWPSPDGRRLLQQAVWRDGPIEIVEDAGVVRPLPRAALEGMAPTFSRYPLAFVRWLDDSVRIVAVSVHTDEARGYAFLAKWHVNTVTGEKELQEERLLLLSAEVSDWRLVPIEAGATARQVLPILQTLRSDKDAWVRKSAGQAIERISQRLAQE